MSDVVGVFVAVIAVVLAVAYARLRNTFDERVQGMRAKLDRDTDELRKRLESEASASRVRLEESYSRLIDERMALWQATERSEIERRARESAQVELSAWRIENEESIRKDAIARSTSVVRGRITEHLIPYVGSFPYDPRDCRQMGAPIDIIIFNGLYSDEGISEVVFAEVKTGKSTLSTRERRLRDVINAGRVRWEEIRLETPEVPAIDTLYQFV